MQPTVDRDQYVRRSFRCEWTTNCTRLQNLAREAMPFSYSLLTNVLRGRFCPTTLDRLAKSERCAILACMTYMLCSPDAMLLTLMHV